MKKNFIALFCILISFNLHSYRYICNGLMANGEERFDDCGPCTDDRAARWENPKVNLMIDYEERPNNITKEDWKEIVYNSINAWNQVEGSDFEFILTNEAGPKDFGENSEVHEIFWITNSDDWRKFVGVGEFGTLGATLPRYTCDENEDFPRKIFDADLVLNGLPYINWEKDCNNEDCISVQTTLVHELGHFLGLDHSCLMCKDSIMSARAVYDTKTLQKDDKKALKKLYAKTKLTSNKKNITFMQEGQNCNKNPCEEGLVCAGPEKSDFSCYQKCKNDEECKKDDLCMNISKKTAICINLNEPIKKTNNNLKTPPASGEYNSNKNSEKTSGCSFLAFTDNWLLCIFLLTFALRRSLII